MSGVTTVVSSLTSLFTSCTADSAVLSSPSSSVSYSEELQRKNEAWNIISYWASEIPDTYSKVPIVSDSGKAPDICSTFWNTLKENPPEYIIKNEPDVMKMAEAYQNAARSYGVDLKFE